ncbi:MAG: DNA repair protein RadC [Proteobacteria bacterium]|nr:DNA repair protein RadC [Pseudomonadota bacterium]
MSETPHYHGHRQRLKERFTAAQGQGMQDYELLELLLTYAIPRRDVKPIAKDLLATFKTLGNVLAASPARLSEVDGVGDSVAVLLNLAHALGMRDRRNDALATTTFENKLDLLDYLYAQMGPLKHEEFRVLFMDAKNKLVGEKTIFRGTVNSAAIYPREIVREAFDAGATGLVLVHNHPSGDPTPSPDDDITTEEVAMVARMVGLQVVDHIIIGDDRHYSYRDKGKL